MAENEHVRKKSSQEQHVRDDKDPGPEGGVAGPAQAAGEQPAAGEELEPLLEDARNKADDHWNLYLRAKADLENMQRRFERDLANAHRFGLEKFVRELLPVKDSMELGLAAVGGESEQVSKLREGMELTLRMLDGALEKIGVQEINPVGEPFNPEYHQAMTVQEAEKAAPNTVLTVMQKGYLLNDRLIRPAMVVVAKAPSQGEPGPGVDEKA